MKKKMRKNKFFQNGPQSWLLVFVLFVVTLVLLRGLTDYANQWRELTYTGFLKQVEDDNVRAARVTGNTSQQVLGELKDGTHFETVIPHNESGVWESLKKHQVDVAIDRPGQWTAWGWFLASLFIMQLAFWLWFLWRNMRGSQGGNSGGAGNLFSMGKSKARLFMPSTIKENFHSVAGATEAKEELEELVDFLKNPDKYKRLGAKMTRGVLLVGEPGNGKTLLAKAVAGEAHCPFFSISGSDFIEVFVGVGAARVRDLFAQARKYNPSIIFIDEIDAVGRHRGSGLGGGNDEREQTLNQLLTEMDGFATAEGTVVIIAATNRPDVLDKALLRPGRFDRRVEVPYPDLKSREQILKVHAKEVKIDPAVDLRKIALGTPGFSGADLANLINEAAIIASKTDQETVTVNDFEEARDKIILGKESKTKIMTLQERELTAYHEAGHALINLLLPETTDPLHKVTIIPRGPALGVTHSIPEREKYTQTKQEIVGKIMVCVGGRAAEELIFDTITTGAGSDFTTATKLARAMVCSLGMSDVGLTVYNEYKAFEYSQQTAAAIDAEVEKILQGHYGQALELLKTNRAKLETLAKALLEKETMYAGEIYELLGITPRQEHLFS